MIDEVDIGWPVDTVDAVHVPSSSSSFCPLHPQQPPPPPPLPTHDLSSCLSYPSSLSFPRPPPRPLHCSSSPSSASHLRRISCVDSPPQRTWRPRSFLAHHQYRRTSISPPLGLSAAHLKCVKMSRRGNEELRSDILQCGISNWIHNWRRQHCWVRWITM